MAGAGPTVSLNPKIDPVGRRAVPQAVTLRPATPDDLELLRHWHRQPHVIAAAGDDWGWEAELARHPDWREQFIAEVGGRPIGFIQIIDPSRDDSQYWGCIAEGHRAIDIWIGDADYLGHGYGEQMMELAIERSFADPTVETILVDPRDCNTRAHRFYERLGFEYVVERQFGEESCFVYRLNRPEDTRGHA